MAFNSGRRAVSTVTSKDAPYARAWIRRIDEIMIGEVARPRSPPVFYKNEFGVVTKRRQFLQFYAYELASGLPIGPHVFGLR